MPESALAEQPIVQPDRRTRIVCGAILSVSLLGLIYVEATKKPKPPLVTATAQWDSRYPPENAVDGDDATDWVLPDKTLGELELRLDKARKVARVTVINARNPPYFDRGSHEIRVDALRGDAIVKSEVVSFNPPTRAVDSRTVNVGAEIDRVRIVVLSYYLTGGGIAEVALESR